MGSLFVFLDWEINQNKKSNNIINQIILWATTKYVENVFNLRTKLRTKNFIMQIKSVPSLKKT